MKAVFKYRFDIQDEINIPMPSDAEILSVQLQGGNPCLWVLVDTDAPTVGRVFHVRGTGHPVADGRYIGTFQMAGGALVFHVFEPDE